MKSFKQFITEEKEEIIIPKVHMWAALLSGDYGQIEAALRSPHHTKEHIDWAMKHKELWVVEAALRSPHHTKEHVDWAMGHDDPDIVGIALKSPHATEEQISDAVNRWSGTWLADRAQRELDRRKYKELE